MNHLLQMYYGDLKIMKHPNCIVILNITTHGNWLSCYHVAQMITTGFYSGEIHKFKECSTEDVIRICAFAEMLYAQFDKEYGCEKYCVNDYYGWEIEWNPFASKREAI